MIDHRTMYMRRRPRNRRPADLQGFGVANGTFGELLQGALSGAENHFLVTLPINRCSKAWFSSSPSDSRLQVISGHKRKSHRLAHGLLRHFGARQVGVLRIKSELPEGKGLASSSADAVATARAISNALGVALDFDVLFRLLRDIEPTDGVMYDGVVAFFHRRVRLLSQFGQLPRPLRIVAIDEGGEVDTLAYNRHCSGYTPREQRTYRALLERVGEVFARGDLAALGRIATRSAVLNQRRNPRRHLAEVLALRRQLGALGVAVTHSGPCIGLLFDSAPRHDEAVEQAREVLGSLSARVSSFRTPRRPGASRVEPWNRRRSPSLIPAQRTLSFS